MTAHAQIALDPDTGRYAVTLDDDALLAEVDVVEVDVDALLALVDAVAGARVDVALDPDTGAYGVALPDDGGDLVVLDVETLLVLIGAANAYGGALSRSRHYDRPAPQRSQWSRDVFGR